MFHGISIEALLAVGYAVFLVTVAAGLEWLAQRSFRRTEQLELAGFHYHRSLDQWECPMGQKLHRAEADNELRIVRYRAPAHACNACSMKRDCTTSDQGREIERQFGAWLNSEVRRFHRGASLALWLLAALILAIMAFWQSQRTDRLLLLGALAVLAAAAIRPGYWQRRRTDRSSLESTQLGITAHQRYPQS
jgi:hypothetical protein